MENQQEEILLECRPTIKQLIFIDGFTIMVIILSLGTALILMLPVLWLRKMSTKYIITSERIIVITGLISQQEEEIEYMRIRDSSYRQGIFARIMKIGWVRITSTDKSAPVMSLLLPDPREWKEKIRRNMHLIKDKKGMRYQEEL